MTKVISKSVVSLSTGGMSSHQRAQHWAEALSRLCGPLHADSFGASTLDGHIDYAILGRLTLCQIEVSRHRVALPTSWIDTANHPVVKILFQTFGTSIFSQGDRILELSPGDCIAYDVSRPHVITSNALTKHDVVIIPKELMRQRGVSLNRLPAQILSARSGAGRLAHDFARSILHETSNLQPENEYGVADALLNVLLLPFSSSDLPKATPGCSRTIRARAKSYIQANLRDPDLTVDRIATALSCTKRYLHMAFKAEGVTVSQYVRDARLEKCRQDLESRAFGVKSITEVAFSWGFSNSTHFNHAFKRQFGKTPSAIRTVARESNEHLAQNTKRLVG